MNWEAISAIGQIFRNINYIYGRVYCNVTIYEKNSIFIFFLCITWIKKPTFVVTNNSQKRTVYKSYNFV